MNRQNFSSGSVWENIVGYSRAVRIGNTIEVSGTTAVNEFTEIVGENDVFAQTFYILQKIDKILVEAGSGLFDVIRTRIFITDMSEWENVAKAHVHFFKDIKPACSLVEVSKLIDERLLVEIEITAIVSEKGL